MSTPTYTPIATITLTSQASQVSFSNLPNTYTDLVIEMNAATSALSDNFIFFNDGVVSFITNRLSANGSTVTGQYFGQTLAQQKINFITPTTTVLGRTSHHIEIFNYSSTQSQKLLAIRASSAGGDGSNAGTEIIAGRWSAFAIPITSLTITASPRTFSPGSTFSLYGIIS